MGVVGSQTRQVVDGRVGKYARGNIHLLTLIPILEGELHVMFPANRLPLTAANRDTQHNKNNNNNNNQSEGERGRESAFRSTVFGNQ